MIYKWTSIFLTIVIIYLLKSYWLPPLKNKLHSNEEGRLSNFEPLPYDEYLNQELNWKESKGIMPFIGSLNYQISREFYSEIGFKVDGGNDHCRVHINDQLSFWLQNYSNKEWLNNSMMFLDLPNFGAFKK